MTADADLDAWITRELAEAPPLPEAVRHLLVRDFAHQTTAPIARDAA